MIILRKRCVCLIIAIIVLLTIHTYAVSARTVDVIPDINFNGTKATCTVQITGDRTTDKIVATAELWQGSVLIDDWSASGVGILKIKEITTVAKNKTYKLTVDYKINGIAQTPVSIVRTNS